MIARLRKKFVLISMVSVIAVLAVLMGIVNVANYVKQDRSSDQVLQLLADNGGAFPDAGNRPGGSLSGTQGDTPSLPADGTAVPPSGGELPQDDNMFGRRGLTAETPYETRFFSVLLGSDGSLSSVNTGKIAAVSTDEAVTMAQALWQNGRASGYSGDYKYLAQASGDGTLYVFLDCTRSLSSFRSFLYTSLLVSLCGILCVFGLVMALSRRAVAPVAESYEKQKQFITNAGHEIKTPLAIIDSCTEVLEMEQGENKWTEGIRGQVKRLTSLTQSLVSLARMDEGSSDLPMADFNLSDAVRETLEPFELMAESRGLRLAPELQQNLIYRGSESALRQLCSILADNAVKYALPGSRIRFSLARRGKRVVLACENEAEGLQSGDQSVLFDRFYRGDASRSSEKGGYGIGLSMAQSIVEAHGGKISAVSPDGKSLVITAQL